MANTSNQKAGPKTGEKDIDSALYQDALMAGR